MAKHFTLEDVQAAVEGYYRRRIQHPEDCRLPSYERANLLQARERADRSNTQGGHLGHSDEPVCQAAVGTSRQATRQNRLNVRFRGGERSVPCFP